MMTVINRSVITLSAMAPSKGECFVMKSLVEIVTKVNAYLINVMPPNNIIKLSTTIIYEFL